ncbi:restriction endonuclease subunit S [Parapedobacter koreensis]|uniref:Type I restriction enzyme, S subunit n=1 Tax=Parapedobacter koreensis TaxID=332977 RepID=A0A1H7FNY0_9SPHI|nr:restriction endonuclease subunit S [Parapedobacter koreensis]SEK25840.1 type I restriction enzyme, S subunit [Parapedobacter koreensis]
MVENNLAYKFQEVEKEIDYTYLPDPLKYTSVSLSDVLNNRLRLEANAFNLEAKVANEKVLANRYGTVKLWSENGLVESAFHRPRFKRIYVDHKEIPFFQPSSIAEIYPKPSRYISAKTETDLESLKVKKGMLLMTVSGTIGKVAIVGRKLDDQIFSHDLLRLNGKGKHDTGYIYAYFLTETGQYILQSNNYGAVIKHIEPDHLKSVIIPNAPEHLKKEIHELVIQSYDLRDQSNELIDKAEEILYEELQLKPIEELKEVFFDNSVEVRNYNTRLSELGLRLDSSYHLPRKRLAKKALTANSLKNVKIGDKSISQTIYTGNRFKRVYVDKSYGAPYLTGKHIMELNPGGFDKKYLSIDQHAAQIKEQLLIEHNSILVTCSGSIGKVVLVPKHWENWVGTHDLIRLIPKDNDIAGYLFCVLNSEYGQLILKSLVYGAVVDHIEAFHVADIEIPILKNQSKQNEINNLVLTANELRHQAFLKEQEAVRKMENVINSTTNSHSSMAAEAAQGYKRYNGISNI